MRQARIKRKYCESEKEHNTVFDIIEQNGDRCIIEPVNSDLPIVPTELVRENMLDIVRRTK